MKTMKRILTAATLALAVTSVNADPITEAVKSEHRGADAKARDEYRNPQQTLRFFGIEPDMKVIEIWPGGGWYTDILADLLKENGELVAAHFFVDDSTRDYYKNSLKKFNERVESHPPYAGITVTAFHPKNALDITEAGTADAVLTFRNVHNWYMNAGKDGVEASFKAFFTALKPGGVLGVVEHEMPSSGSDEDMEKSGYMKRDFVIAAAKAAGFELEASSDINANPMDNASHPRGVWTLPPTLALKDEDRAKYLAIGESNRMTLKFVKPEA